MESFEEYMKGRLSEMLAKSIDEKIKSLAVQGNGLRNKPGFEALADLNANMDNDERKAEWIKVSSPTKAMFAATWN